MVAIEVWGGDITEMAVDAIVNAANTSLAGGGGVDGAIHRAGGPSIVRECHTIVAERGPCPTGDAVITGGGLLPARYVIHTVGPIWGSDTPDEQDRQLTSCYTRSLELAVGHRLTTIAFPNISTGVYGFPKSRAATIAVNAVRSHVATAETMERVTFVCFDEENRRLYDSLLD